MREVLNHSTHNHLLYYNELRHRGIDAVYVGVELLYKYDRTTLEFLT